MFFGVLDVDSWVPTAAGSQPAVAAGGPRWGPRDRLEEIPGTMKQDRQNPYSTAVWGTMLQLPEKLKV